MEDKDFYGFVGLMAEGMPAIPLRRFKRIKSLEEISEGIVLLFINKGRRSVSQATVGPDSELNYTKIGHWDDAKNVSINPVPTFEGNETEYLTQERIDRQEIYVVR